MASVGKSPTAAAVPPGGTAGQVLAKTSGADFDTGWADQGGASPVFISGTWYDNRRVPLATASSAVPLTLNYAYYVPYYFSTSVRVSGVGFYAISSGTNIVYVAVAPASPATGLPGTIQAAVQISINAAGGYSDSINTTISAGWNYLVISPFSTAVTVAGGIAGMRTPGASSFNLNAAQTSYYLDATSGTVVNNPPVTAVEALAVPVIWFRVT